VTIRDLGYQRYEGPRLPLRSRYGALIGRTLSLAWASGLVKATFIVSLFPMIVCAVVIYFKMQVAQQLAAFGAPIKLDDPGFWVFYCIYWCQLWFAFTMSLLVGAPAISDDVRTGAFQFYFARPGARSHYLLGKLVPVGLLVVVVSAGPGLLLAIFRTALSQSGKDALHGLALLVGTIIFSLIYAAVMALLPLALSSLTRRSGATQGAWAAAFFLPWFLGEGMAAATGVPYAVLVSIPTNLRLLGQHLYGMPPSYPIPWYLPAGILLGLVVTAGWLLLRRLARVEVFS